MIPHDHPLANNPNVTLAELRKNPLSFLIRTSGQGCMTISRADATLPFDARHHSGGGRGMTIIGLVSAGLGVSILPASLNVFSSTKCAGCRLLKRMRFRNVVGLAETS